jgi:hypothetical protein
MGAQNLPQYYILNGDTAGIILSIDQIKRIKNDLELKNILEDMKISCDSVISKYIVLVDDYEKRVVSLNTLITKLDSSDKSKTKIINSINTEFDLMKKDRDLNRRASLSKDTLINNTNIILSKVKNQRNWAYGSTTLLLITTVLLFIFH